MTMLRFACVMAVTLMSHRAWAHKPSDAHLTLHVSGDRVEARLDVAVRDLDGALDLDRDGDGEITWRELSAAAPRFERYVENRLSLATNRERCPLALGMASLVDLSDGPYWAQPLVARCATPVDTLEITYQLLFDIDAQHRGLVHLDGANNRTLIVRDPTPVTIELGVGTSIRAFIVEGVWHIWNGIDHILFLTALILPAVTRRSRRPGRALLVQESLRGAAIEVLEIVTAFTLAHSITLVLSAVGLVRLPSRLVETAIALSVVAAAANNLVRVVDARWAVAFALGLLHGFGFSSVLIDLGLPSHELIGALLGFNLGVELGQAAFVIVLLPLLFVLRRTFIYRVLLWGGSVAIVVLASVWSYQRWFP